MTRTKKISVLSCAVFTMLCAAAVSSAQTDFYVTIEGAKQGKFKGESSLDAHKSQIAGLDFNYAVEFSSGKRQHGPVTFMKALGEASPQIFQALTTHEVLKRVDIDFVQSDDKGTETVYYTIRLTNATVTGIRQHVLQSPVKCMAEDVSITFQKIDVESKTGKTMASDDATK